MRRFPYRVELVERTDGDELIGYFEVHQSHIQDTWHRFYLKTQHRSPEYSAEFDRWQLRNRIAAWVHEYGFPHDHPMIQAAEVALDHHLSIQTAPPRTDR